MSSHNHQLLYQLTARYIQERYRSSMLGVVWAILTPLVMLAIYSFVFTVVFKAQWGEGVEGIGAYALILFTGITLHGFFMESLSQSAILITSNPNYVKKVVFPLELLVPARVGGALFQYLVSFTILLVALLVCWPSLHMALFFAPLILLPFILLTLGISYTVAALGVYFRDIAHMMGILGSVLFFTATIVYPASHVPESYRIFLYLNPLSYVVEALRGVLMFHTLPALLPYSVYCTVSITVFGIGLWCFRRLKRGFADVL